RRWDVDIDVVGQNKAQAFRVEEEEGLVLDDRAAYGTRPLVRIGERLRGNRWRVGVQPIVAVHGDAVPPVLEVAVESIGAGLGHVGDLRSGQLSVLARVRVADNGGFLHLVRTDGEVGRTRVVDVEIRIHVVLAVDREQVRGRRQALDSEVPVALSSVHHRARSGLGNTGEVTTGIR